MGNNTGVGGNVISAPSGGGAQKGMGEKFSPDLFTGTGNFSVPIALPPGRNGFQPEISLVYSTGNGNGPFGLGWGLSIPGVSRKTSKGIPVYDDKKDVFLLSGAEDLVPVPSDPAFPTPEHAQRYRPRTEGLFARIDHYHDRDNDYWKVWSKDGLISWYGTPGKAGSAPDEKGILRPLDPAVCADPAYLDSGRPKVFDWKLTKTQDPFGNIIQYTYKRDIKNTKDAHHWDMLYLDKIEYVDYPDPAPGATLPLFLVKVLFNYEARPDPFSFYKAGFEIRTIQRCATIETYTRENNTDLLTKTYHLHYNQQVTGVNEDEIPQYKDIAPPLNGASQLTQVGIEGHNGLETEHMPPLEFSYTTFEPKKRDFYPLEGRDLPPYSLANKDYELAAMFGNGLPDIIQLNGVARYWKNLGGGKYDMPRMMKNAPAGVQLGDPEVQMMDTNGDGKIDLVVNKPGVSGFFPLEQDGLWDTKSFRRYDKVPSFNLADPEVKLVDLDGDGITDAIRNGARFECFYQDPEKGFYKVQTVEKQRLKNFPNVSFADPRVRFADMTGDGMQDIVLIHDGNVEYWPNMGHGKWGERVQMLKNPRYPYQYDPKRILIGDVDGDGIADLVYVDNNTVTLWINQNGNQWSEPIVIDGTPPMYDTASVRLADMLGSGVSGIVWSYDFDRLTKDRLYLLDFTGGYKPYLLHEMNNHMGAITRVEYKPSTFFYVCDENGYDPFLVDSGLLTVDSKRRSQATPMDLPVNRTRKPTPWKTTLPFPVQVVSKTEVIDELSLGKLVTMYAYSHGYWDGGEREFRGFGKVIQRDTETFERYNNTILNTSKGYTETNSPPFKGGVPEGRGGSDGSSNFLPVHSEHYTVPTETRTWFHLGPIGEGVGDWNEVYFNDEYWQEDPSILEQPASMRATVKALPRRAKRDAYRALRGSMLRTELYALDKTAKQNRPYTVTENLYGVRKEFEPETDSSFITHNSSFIFFPHSLASRSTQWERGSEPMTSFSFTDNYDPKYGLPETQVTIAVPRGKNPLTGLSFPKSPSGMQYGAAAKYFITLSRTQYTHRDDPDYYLIGRVKDARSFEVPLESTGSVFALHTNILADIKASPLLNTGLLTLNYSLLTHSLTFYDSITYYNDDSFDSIEDQTLGNYGVAVRTETLVMNSLNLSGLTIPAYINHLGELPASWAMDPGGDNYPDGFQEYITLHQNLGYKYYSGAGGIHLEGYYCTAERKKFDFQLDPGTGRGLVLEMKDPLGNIATVEYDDYKFLPEKVNDPAGMQTNAAYDYRTFQAKQVTDPNGNISVFDFSPLGFLRATAVIGKGTGTEGDYRTASGTFTERYEASSKLDYNFMSFLKSGDPVWVKTTAREKHYVNDHDSPTLTSVEYSDGFGRLLQSRAQAEEVIFGNPVFGDSALPANQNSNIPAQGEENTDDEDINVVVSGWQVYNNKGKVVEKYEPFYDKGFDYSPPSQGGVPEGGGGSGGGSGGTGQKIKMYYDPRGQVIRTVNPDNTEQRVIFGIPLALDNPDIVVSTPWESYTYDANDLAELYSPPLEGGVPEGGGGLVPTAHHYTPSSSEIDALGRSVKTIDRLAMSGDDVIMEYQYDIRGNLLKVLDAIIIVPGGPGRVAFEHKYDLANRPLWTKHIDAGIKTVVYDCMGKPVEMRDSKEALVINTYDKLNRPVKVWARDKTGEKVTLRHRTIYGDDPEFVHSPENNMKGKPYKMYDEAGMTTTDTYDFKGNPAYKIRQVIKDTEILKVFGGSTGPDGGWGAIKTYRADWEVQDESILDPVEYRTDMAYDALNRVIQMTYPEDVEGERKVLLPTYNKGGAMESVLVKNSIDAPESRVSVERVAYNAKGQRVLIAYGNGIMTRYRYDEVNFRLTRMKSEKYIKTDLTYTPNNGIKQNFAYTYDLAGNILTINDKTTGCGYGATPNELTREFEYDPLYRLSSANGREKDTVLPSEWDETYYPEDTTAKRFYTQNYEYDKMGNIQLLQHVASAPFTREFTYDSEKNTLASIEAGSNTYNFTHDVNGNITEEGTSRKFEFDYADRLRAFKVQVGSAEPSQYAHYLYDAGGSRVKKIVRKQNGDYTSVTYIDGIFEHIREGNPGPSIPELAIGEWVIGQEDVQFGISGTKIGETFIVGASAAYGMREQNLLHVMDGNSRMATIRVGNDFGDTTPEVKYNLEDHLGSSTLVLSENGSLISGEEYYPFGETSFGSYSKKRYRFCGKEKDGESGLYYYGMRYYSAWTCRFVSVDPLASVMTFETPYSYGFNNPIRFNDPLGLAPSEKGGDDGKKPKTNQCPKPGQRYPNGGGEKGRNNGSSGKAKDKSSDKGKNNDKPKEKTPEKRKAELGHSPSNPPGKSSPPSTPNSSKIIPKIETPNAQEAGATKGTDKGNDAHRVLTDYIKTLQPTQGVWKANRNVMGHVDRTRPDVRYEDKENHIGGVWELKHNTPIEAPKAADEAEKYVEALNFAYKTEMYQTGSKGGAPEPMQARMVLYDAQTDETFVYTMTDPNNGAILWNTLEEDEKENVPVRDTVKKQSPEDLIKSMQLVITILVIYEALTWWLGPVGN